MTNNKGNNELENENTSFGTDKRNIYQVPKNYFVKLQDSIEKKIIEADLDDLNLPDRNIYNVPDHYFDSLKQLKVADPQAETKVVSLKKWRKSIILKVAASVAIIFSIAYFGSLYLKSDPANKIMLATSDDYNFTISEYETGLFDETEDELIASLIFEENENTTSFETIYISNKELTIDELDEYLDSDFELNIEF